MGCIAVLIASLLLLSALLPGAASGGEARPEFCIGNVVYGNDASVNGMSQILAHQQTLASTDDESFALSFLDGSGALSPAIAQTSSDTVAATTTGFFAANFLFNPVTNMGAPPVGVGQIDVPSPVTTAKFSGPSLLYPEMVVQGNLLGKGELKDMARAGFSFPPAQAVVANATVWQLGKMESDQGAVGFRAIDKGLPVILSAHHFDFVSSPAQINNTSIVERLWRNSHQGNLMDYLYEGDAAYPQQIMPIKKPLLLVSCGDMSNAVKQGLAMTRPGSLLRRSLWSL